MATALRSGVASRRLMLATVLVGSLCATTANASLIIDDFISTSFPASWPVSMNESGFAVINETSLGSTVLGGSRQTTISALNVGPGSTSLLASVGAGLFDFVSNNSTSGNVQFLYDGGASAGTGNGLGVNMTDQMGILIDIGIFDMAGGNPLPITVTLNDGSTTATLSRSLTSMGSQTVQFEFANFSGVGALNLDAIESIHVEFDPAAGADFRVQRISTVIPAPGALAILGLGGLLTSRRRRRG